MGDAEMVMVLALLYNQGFLKSSLSQLAERTPEPNLITMRGYIFFSLCKRKESDCTNSTTGKGVNQVCLVCGLIV